MCGIAGTVFNKKYLNGIEVSVENLLIAFDRFKSCELTSEDLLDLVWKYKSNINFLRFCKNKNERDSIKKLCKLVKGLAKAKKHEIPKIDKSVSYDSYNKSVQDLQNLLDVEWFLSFEIPNCLNSIEYISECKVNSLDDDLIIFYRHLTNVINAIDNRLELRGRDSFGISIVLNTKDLNLNDEFNTSFEKKSESYVFSNNKNLSSLSFAFRVASLVGSIGENAKELKRLIKKSHLFNNFVIKNNFDSATIMAHTRWASVGGINLENTHPFFYKETDEEKNIINIGSILNGDIYNYKEIIKSAKSFSKFSVDESLYSSDCVAIPALLSNEPDINLKSFSRISNNLNGSFVIGVQHTLIPDQILLIKKGIQGLYLGFSYDGLMFASDVYGLVESCRYFTPVESDYSTSISTMSNGTALNPNIRIWSQKLNESTEIKFSDLKVTRITTRDIDKKGYDHFLLKEIHDTSDIVSRTLNNYIQPKNSIREDSINRAITISESQIPAFIISNFKNNQIKKIILTGMGTCYTAAVAISMFMRARLKKLMPNILVEPHIATEGSGFYLQSNMQDTLVIVVAQSGTTVDTNVYVQMAKERGAMSIAIANKREGDVTFIVDGTLYTGDGRDIEIAVPSTKTYSAHVILGYIVTIFFASKLARNSSEKKLLFNDIENLMHADSLINKSLLVFQDRDLLDQISIKGCIHNSWFIVRDQTSNSVCAEEIRIKYSENCYQSVSSLEIQDLKNIELKDSFIVLVTEGNTKSIENIIIKLIDSNNSVIILSTGLKISKNLKNYEQFQKIILVNLPCSTKYFTFLPTIIAGQILSYHQAIVLDSRKSFFIDLNNALDSKEEIRKVISSYNEFFTKNHFRQGFSVTEFNDLQALLQRFIHSDLKIHSSIHKKLKSHINKMMFDTRRTIDTIKHQAKTITVGAVREDNETGLMGNQFFNINEDNFFNYAKILNNLFNSLHQSRQSQNPIFLNNYEETLIAFEGIDEAFAYNVSNIVNDASIKQNINPQLKLARSYDYPNEDKTSHSFWIILTESNIDNNISFLKYLKNEQYIVFNFSQWILEDDLIQKFYVDNNPFSDFKRALWSLFIGLYISKKGLLSNESNFDDADLLTKKNDFEINRQLNSLIMGIKAFNNSKEINLSIKHAARLFLIRKNWKCIGSGVNFNLSKIASKKIINQFKRSCAFDVLENHKHIDISAESSVIILVANIWKQSYQDDAYSEIAKLTAHNNIPIIITNDGDERFDNMSFNLDSDNYKNINLGVPVIKIAKVGTHYSFPIGILVIEKFIEEIEKLTNSKNSETKYQVSFHDPQWEKLYENIWQ